MPVMPGWAMPPSMGALPNYPPGYPFAQQGPERPHPMGSLTERLGATLRLGVDLLNAALARGTSMLGGGAMQWDAHDCGCGAVAAAAAIGAAMTAAMPCLRNAADPAHTGAGAASGGYITKRA